MTAAETTAEAEQKPLLTWEECKAWAERYAWAERTPWNVLALATAADASPLHVVKSLLRHCEKLVADVARKDEALGVLVRASKTAIELAQKDEMRLQAENERLRAIDRYLAWRQLARDALREQA